MFALRNIVKTPLFNLLKTTKPLFRAFSSNCCCGNESCHCNCLSGGLGGYEPAAVLTPAPSFKAKAWFKGDFKEISLNDYKGKYVVLFFYPADFTFVCPTEIIEFSKKSPEFKQTSKLSLKDRLRGDWLFS